MILTIGDPHFKCKNQRETDILHEKCCTLIRERQPDMVIVMGDVLDRHEQIHVGPLTRAVKFLRDLSSLCPVYLIIGNHDRPNNSDFLSDLHPFTALRSWDNLTLVDKTMRVNDFVLVPYVPPGRFIEALNLVEGWQQATAIFAHQEIRGCKMGVVTSEHGDVWPLYYPPLISGHIHDYQHPQANVWYVGTPFQHAFGDSEDKTVSLYTISDTVVEERISLGILPKVIIHLLYDEIDNFTPDPTKEVKIVVVGTTAQIKAAMKMSRIHQWKTHGIIVVYAHQDEKTPTTSIRTDRQNYLSLLYETVKDDDQLRAVFTELFGSMGKGKVRLRVIE
jgi:3',5'-cyclic AMP phosphodiesterase CpdA